LGTPTLARHVRFEVEVHRLRVVAAQGRFSAINLVGLSEFLGLLDAPGIFFHVGARGVKDGAAFN